MGTLAGKIWGSTELVITTPLFEAHRLLIKPNHECSLHEHKRKWNAFLVVRGVLYIDVVKNDYKLTDTTELHPGQFMTVSPGEHHKFRTGKKSCEAFEFYYLDILSNDIFRKNHGGKAKRR